MKRKFILRFKFFLSVLFLSPIIFTSCNNLTDAASLEPTDKNEVILESATAATSASTDENYVTLSGSLSTGGAYPEEIARTLSGEKVTEDSSSRSAFPAVSTTDTSLTYTITAKCGDKTFPGTISSDKKSYTVAIPVQSEAMTCTVEASIKKGTATLFTGESESFTISSENQVVEVPAITLKAPSSGKGSIGLEINVEGSGISYCTVKLDGEPISEDNGSEKFEPSSNKITVTKSDVDAKVYLGEFSFYDSSNVLIYSFREYGINVISNLTTNTWISNADPLEEWFQLTGSGNIATCRITAAMVEDFLLPPEIYVDPNATRSTESGSLWNPCKTFSKAIEKLTDASKDYTIFIKGKLEGSGFEVPESLIAKAKTLTLCGATGLDSDGNPQDSLDGGTDSPILIIESDIPVILTKLLITNGASNDQGVPGGILIEGNDVTISDGVVIKDNISNDLDAIGATSGSFKIKGSAYIPAGYNGTTGKGKNDVGLSAGQTIKIAGKLTPPKACTDGIVATITPASYTADTQLIELDTTETSLAEASGHFAVTQPGGGIPWFIADGKLKKGLATSVENLEAALADVSANTTTTPYELIISDEAPDLSTLDSLITNSGKYFNLSFSNATFTSLNKISDNVINLTIPASVTYVTSSAGSGNRQNVYVDEANTKYKSVDGVLYSKDGKTLVAYMKGRTDTSYTIPDTVEIIGEKAFYSTKISSLTIPSSVTTIGKNAFYGCALTSVTIPGNVKTIKEGAFSYMRLSSLTLEEGIETIEESAFQSTWLTSVTIPASVTSLGLSTVQSIFPFADCLQLQEFAVASGSTSFSAYDGALYQGTTFIACPYLKSGTLKVKGDTTACYSNISYNAFGLGYKCNKITKIVFEEGIEEIVQQFKNLEKATEMVVPTSVTKISGFPKDVTTVHYRGSAADKANITITNEPSSVIWDFNYTGD